MFRELKYGISLFAEKQVNVVIPKFGFVVQRLLIAVKRYHFGMCRIQPFYYAAFIDTVVCHVFFCFSSSLDNPMSQRIKAERVVSTFSDIIFPSSGKNNY